MLLQGGDRRLDDDDLLELAATCARRADGDAGVRRRREADIVDDAEKGRARFARAR
jgi:hypothetical protein